MTESDVLKIFHDSGALLEGHFILRSGLHSRQFFQCALALQEMPTVEKFGAALAKKVRPLGAVTVIAPAMGGVGLGQGGAGAGGPAAIAGAVHFRGERRRQTCIAPWLQNYARRKNSGGGGCRHERW